jgi:hypothetical protein
MCYSNVCSSHLLCEWQWRGQVGNTNQKGYSGQHLARLKAQFIMVVLIFFIFIVSSRQECCTTHELLNFKPTQLQALQKINTRFRTRIWPPIGVSSLQRCRTHVPPAANFAESTSHPPRLAETPVLSPTQPAFLELCFLYHTP